MSYFGPCKKKCIDKYSYLSTNILGQGYSGTVYLGKHEVTGNVCAIKIIEKSILKYQAHKSMILCQIEFLNILKDQKNILTLYEVYNTKNNIYIVSELCNTDLKEYITAKKIIPEAQCIDIMKNIIVGFKSIWKAKIVHRDLKPSNILLKDSQVKIADFGFSMYEKDKKQYEKINVGSPYYMPLQVLGYNSYGYQSDIWALGIIFFQMLTGRTPWKARTQKDLFTQLKQFKIEKLMPQNISQKSKEFLTKTLIIDPKKRMSPEQLVDFVFQNDQQQEAIDLRNSIRSQNAHSLQKTIKKTRTLHDPQKGSRININVLIDNVNKEKSQKTNEGNDNDSDKNSANDQNEDLYLGVNNGVINNDHNILANSRMKNQSNQQKIDSVEQLPPTLKKKKNIQRKTSLQVNYQPFQNQKSQNNTQNISQAKRIQSLKFISNPQVIIIAKNQKLNQLKGIKKQMSQKQKLFQKPKQINQTPVVTENNNKQQIQKNKQFQIMKKFSKYQEVKYIFVDIYLSYQKGYLMYFIRIKFNKILIQITYGFIYIQQTKKNRKLKNRKLINNEIMVVNKIMGQNKKSNKTIQTKYKIQLQDLIIIKDQKQFSFDKFKKLLRKSILHLYKRAYDAYIADEQKGTKQSKLKVKRSQSQKSTEEEQDYNESQIMKVKEQIIILDYFITLKQLLRLEQKYGWEGFQQKANIQTIVQGDTLKYIQKKHILAISQKLQNLKIL